MPDEGRGRRLSDMVPPFGGIESDQGCFRGRPSSVCVNIDCGVCGNISNNDQLLNLASIEDMHIDDMSTTVSDRDSGIFVDSPPFQSSSASQMTTPPTSMEPDSCATSLKATHTDGGPVEQANRQIYDGLCTIHPIYEVEEFINGINLLPTMMKNLHDKFGAKLHEVSEKVGWQKSMIEEVGARYAEMRARVDKTSAELEAKVSRDVIGIDAKVTMALECLGVDVTFNQPGMEFAGRLTEQLDGIEKKFEDRVKGLQDKVNGLMAGSATAQAEVGFEQRLAALERKFDLLRVGGDQRVQAIAQKRHAAALEQASSPSPIKKARPTLLGSSTRGKEPSTFPARTPATATFKTPVKALEKLHQRRQQKDASSGGHGKEGEGSSERGHL